MIVILPYERRSMFIQCVHCRAFGLQVFIAINKLEQDESERFKLSTIRKISCALLSLTLSLISPVIFHVYPVILTSSTTVVYQTYS